MGIKPVHAVLGRGLLGGTLSSGCRGPASSEGPGPNPNVIGQNTAKPYGSNPGSMATNPSSGAYGAPVGSTYGSSASPYSGTSTAGSYGASGSPASSSGW